MYIFVNNKAVEIFNDSQHHTVYDSEIFVLKDTKNYEELSGKILVMDTNNINIFRFIEYLQEHEISNLNSIHFYTRNLEKFKKELKIYFEFVKAAGGVVKNKAGKILMMKRNGRWDLPKGKAEKNETSEITAIREVEEECNVKVTIGDKLCSTWHTYVSKGKLIVKRTRWYNMNLVSDKLMSPQAEEGIEELQWMNDIEVDMALKNSYNTISHIIENYRKQ